MDYETFIRNRNKPRPSYIPSKNYLVFLADTPWGGHDFELSSFQTISKTSYKKIINNFFNELEKKTNLEIIISAHPKQTQKDNIYFPRKFCTQDTEQLIKYSKGLVCHFSGAISYAILNSKPICFFYHKNWENIDYFSYNIQRYQEALKNKFNVIDDTFNCEKIKFFYNKKMYKEYIKKYLSYRNRKKFFYWDEIFNQMEKYEF